MMDRLVSQSLRLYDFLSMQNGGRGASARNSVLLELRPVVAQLLLWNPGVELVIA